VSFDWSEYLALAEDLCGVPISGAPAGTDAGQRSGVSRAYYASFILARNRLRDVDRVQIPQLGNVHRFVADHYENHTDPVRVQIGIELRRLRTARNRRDYDDVVGQLPTLATRSLTRAAQIVEDLRRL
jgi:hypothetical protein